MRLNSVKIAAVTILTALLVLAFAAGALAAPPWSDAPDAWWITSYGVTSAQVATVAEGYPESGTFKPANPVTRGQFAKMAVSGLGIPTANPVTATFKDVAKGSTFFIYVEAAYDEGLITGYPSGTGLEYRPANNITRQQANSILGRYLSQLELDTTGVIHGPGSLTYSSLALWYQAQGSFYLDGFVDSAKVAADHRATTAYLVYRDVIEGSQQGSQWYLNPTATLNRAQAAVMVLRVAEVAEDISTPPSAPTGLVVSPGSPGNDPTPQVSGVAMPSSSVAVYDTFGGATTKVTDTATNAAGIFYADLTTPLVDGTHVFTAKVRNAAGLVSAASAPVTYVLDTVAPTGAITVPSIPTAQPDAAVKLNKPSFAATATDATSGVEDVEFQYSVKQTTPSWQTISTDSAPNQGTSTYTAEWPTSGTLSAGLADGQYVFRVVISDNAGNTATSATVDVTVDTKAPTAQIAPGTLVPNLGDILYTENNKPQFGATADDTTGGAAGTLASGVARVEFLYAPMTPAPVAWSSFTLISADLGSSGFAVYPSAGLVDGTYLFAVRSTDRAGNESLLMTGNPAAYVAGVTRQVVIDNAAPVVAVTAPIAGALVPDSTNCTITWTLTDVSAPTTVRIEFSPTGADPWTEIAAAAPFTGTTGTYSWAVPDITGADVTTYRVRITAIDKAGVPVGDVAGHTSVATSAAFTVYDAPAVATNVVGSDPDTTADSGVDWRDFHAAWTVSTSAHIVLQRVYLLPSAQTLNLAVAPVDQPVKSFSNNTTAVWDSDSTLIADSRGAALAAGNYKVYVVVGDPAGRTAVAESATFTVAAP